MKELAQKNINRLRQEGAEKCFGYDWRTKTVRFISILLYFEQFLTCPIAGLCQKDQQFRWEKRCPAGRQRGTSLHGKISVVRSTHSAVLIKCNALKRILREARSWKIAMSGEHPDRNKILPLLGVFTVPSDEKFLPALVSELCEGNLDEYIEKSKPNLSERLRLVWYLHWWSDLVLTAAFVNQLYEVAEALAYCKFSLIFLAWWFACWLSSDST